MSQINTNPTAQVLRSFSRLWLPAFVVLVSVLLYRHLGQSWAIGAGGIGALVVLGCLLHSGMARLVFVGLLVITYPVGFIVSHLILAVLYFAILTPIGLCARLFGYDPMRRSFKEGQTSYWIERNNSRSSKSYFRQY